MANLRITFTRREAGAYVHTATGVEIHRGESGKWFVYEPSRGAGVNLVAARPTKALAEIAARQAVTSLRAELEASHLAALHEAAERIVAADGADALVHRVTELNEGGLFSDCGVDLLVTPYTYGSPIRAEVTCPACIARFAPIRL